jgi:asparagine synthase (glutamine-hydrolysing)
MCGISGFVFHSRQQPDYARKVLEKMAGLLSHRGPDATGTYILEEDGPGGTHIGLSHTLLSIVGNKEEGKQPFVIPNGVLAFNGIIYNHSELRERLRSDFEFKTRTDTEVLAYGLKLEGTEFLKRIAGFYSLAFLDLRKNILTLARDPFGVKPLYVYHNNSSLLFSSEYKSILPFLRDLDVDSTAVEAYLRLRYVPTNWTLFRQIRKLEPGHALEISIYGGPIQSKVVVDPFDAKALETKLPNSEDLFQALKVAVQRRAVADVRVAALLSGGIDSSAVCELLSDRIDQLHTYTLGFAEPHLDESNVSRKIAETLHLPNLTIPQRPKSIKQLTSLAYHLDDPYGDPIILALDDIFSFIQSKERVIVTGEGADELFSGYVHHRALYLYLSTPSLLRNTLPSLSAVLPRTAIASLLPYSGTLTANDLDVAHRRFTYFIQSPSLSTFASIFDLFDAADFRGKTYQHTMTWGNDELSLENLRARDLRIWLSDSQLFKLDKISMKYGIEAREPFVDLDLVREVLRLDPRKHFGLGGDKIPLRSALEGRAQISALIGHSRKKSFFQPLGSNENGPFYKEMKSLISGERNFLENWLEPKTVEALLQSNCDQILDQKKIFSLSMLAAWNSEVRSTVGREFRHAG